MHLLTSPLAQTIAPSLDVATIRDSVLDSALALVNDPIPNIRFNVAKALETLGKVLMQSPEGREIAHAKVLPALEQLKEDQDADVRWAPSHVVSRRPALMRHGSRYFAAKAYDRTRQAENGGEPMMSGFRVGVQMVHG